VRFEEVEGLRKIKQSRVRCFNEDCQCADGSEFARLGDMETRAFIDQYAVSVKFLGEEYGAGLAQVQLEITLT